MANPPSARSLTIYFGDATSRSYLALTTPGKTLTAVLLAPTRLLLIEAFRNAT
jgi:hypothetical protein